MRCSGSVRHEVATRGGSRRPPRFSSIDSARAVASRRTRASSSPIVSSGTSVRRSAPSSRMPRVLSERSTAIPSARDPLTSMISLSGSRAPTEGCASTPSSSSWTPSIAPISSRASAASPSPVREQFPAALLEQRARAVDRREQTGRGTRRLEHVEGRVEPAEVEVAAVAGEQHRTGRERGQGLVRRDRDGVGAQGERGGGHVGMEAEVAGPGLVADERDAARVRELGDALDVRDDPEPGWLHQQDGARLRLGRQRRLDGLDRVAERNAPALVDRRGDPHRPGTESTRPAATDLCEQRETTTGSPSLATARQSAWLGCVEPLPVKRQRSAPKAVAASCSARCRMPALPRRSSAPPKYGVSLASSGSSPVRAGLRLWPGVENAVAPSRRNAATASSNGVSGTRHVPRRYASPRPPRGRRRAAGYEDFLLPLQLERDRAGGLLGLPGSVLGCDHGADLEAPDPHQPGLAVLAERDRERLGLPGGSA